MSYRLLHAFFHLCVRLETYNACLVLPRQHGCVFSEPQKQYQTVVAESSIQCVLETLYKVCVSQITLCAKDPTYNLIVAELEVKQVEN